MSAVEVGEGSLAEGLGRTLSEALGLTVRIEELEPLGGGASREITAFDAVTDDGVRRQLVLRRNPGKRSADSLEAEFSLLAVAYRHGVPVPEPIVQLNDPALGGGYVMARVDGETLGPRILKSDALVGARASLARRCGEVLATTHSIPLTEVPFMRGSDDGDPAAAQIAYWRATLDELGEPHPVLELALLRLADTAPSPVAPALVHGDFRNGDLVVGPDGLRAVLDWELAHAGDPLEDLGWLCVRAWRFSRPDLPVGGFGARQDLFEGYETVSGCAVDEERVRYWELFGYLKWAVICVLQADTHLSGALASHELAAIGRRTCEPEWDLLRLLTAEAF